MDELAVNAEALFDAVERDDVERVLGIVESRPELVNATAPGDHGMTPLHYAVIRRRAKLVEILMAHGANARQGIYPLNYVACPLNLAVERGYEDIAAIIRGEESRRDAVAPPIEDSMRQRLQQALYAGDEDRAIELLGRTDGDLQPVLRLASALLLPRVVEWLLAKGADPSIPGDDGSTALEAAGQMRGGPEFAVAASAMRSLLQKHGAKISARASAMDAIARGDASTLRSLHAQTDLVTPQDDSGWLARVAVDHDRPGILKLLLELGHDPDARIRVEDNPPADSWGMPLYECARNGKHEMAEILLARGADPNGQVYASGTPLSEAYGQIDGAMIALLIRYGGKPNASMAGLYRRMDVAVELLEKHGDTPLPDDGFSSGPVAEQLIGGAAKGGDPEILRLAIGRAKIADGDPKWQGFLQAPLAFWNHGQGPWCHPEWDRSTYLECFKLILERSGPPNGLHRFGATILHLLVLMRDHVTPEERVAFAQALLDAGARTDIRDRLFESTPLGWACRWGREELVRLFLARGVDSIEADAEPWATPLAWAEKKGHMAIAELLREHRTRAFRL